MPFDGLVSGRTVLGGVGERQAGPRGVVAGPDGSQPGGADGEARAGVKVPDQCPDAGEVVGVEGRGLRLHGSGSRCHGCRQAVAAARLQRESPQFGSGLLAPAAEEDFAVLLEDRDGLLLEEDTAAVVAEGPYPHQVVVEAGHDVAADVVGAVAAGLQACLVQTGKFRANDLHQLPQEARTIASINDLFKAYAR